jgi:L-ascorbate peroxidase
MLKSSLVAAIALAAGAEAFVAPATTNLAHAKVSATSPMLRTAPLATGTRGGRSSLKLSMSASVSAEKVQQLKECKQALAELLDKTNANPLMVRLAWHDSGTYDKAISDWPKCGGAIGSIRFEPEITHGANAGELRRLIFFTAWLCGFDLSNFLDAYDPQMHPPPQLSERALSICRGNK